MTLTREAGDIAHAVAYSSGTGFGRLDQLQFNMTVIPEPTTTVLGVVFAVAFVWVRSRRQA
jgi:hypothetical protein